jgi:hypothetical protein
MEQPSIKRKPRKEPTSTTEICALAGKLCSFSFTLWTSGLCDGSIQIWFQMDVILTLFMLVNSLISKNTDRYMKYEFLLKSTKILGYFVSLIWTIIGGLFAYVNWQCYDQWKFGFIMIIFFNSIIFLLIAVSAILLCGLLIPEFIRNISTKERVN